MGMKEEITQSYSEEVWKDFFELARMLQSGSNHSFENEELLYSSLSVRGSKLRNESFERMEYLGDSIYGALVGLILFDKYPTFSPKELTNYRSKVARNSYIAKLSERLLLDKIAGVFQTGNLSEGQKADLFEAYIGAVFKDTGSDFERTKGIVASIIDWDEVAKEVVGQPWKDTDAKGFLITQVQKQYGSNAQLDYKIEHLGPQNAQEFVATIEIRSKDKSEVIERPGISSERCTSKKAAEKDCAMKLLELWKMEGKIVE